jgi:hypothetical protein
MLFRVLKKVYSVLKTVLSVLKTGRGKPEKGRRRLFWTKTGRKNNGKILYPQQ